jgi:hypothetical protein
MCRIENLCLDILEGYPAVTWQRDGTAGHALKADLSLQSVVVKATETWTQPRSAMFEGLRRKYRQGKQIIES